MWKYIAFLAVALFVVSIIPGFAQQQPPQTSTTDRPALEDQRSPKTNPAKTPDKPGAMTPERQKSDGDNPMAGDQTRPDKKKPMKKSDKSTKRQGQSPERMKTTDGPQGQYMPPVPERK